MKCLYGVPVSFVAAETHDAIAADTDAMTEKREKETFIGIFLSRQKMLPNIMMAILIFFQKEKISFTKTPTNIPVGNRYQYRYVRLNYHFFSSIFKVFFSSSHPFITIVLLDTYRTYVRSWIIL